MAYPIPANKGTLVPGQTISVNKYTVQVERYLSQGGFAHVYLVRTAQPVFGTTRHVLKRVACQNEAMLAEVKKEVDIMRILRGHPNIVYLIDAAWNQLVNGVFEVFILMEFCQGGGIIDMMNRRLRERLTEAEILQIFVDVCEGVAAMHNLKPALLHRDLKVENILQASATSYKLCDFGSATPTMTRPPASSAEVRALEADLNRHTTLQYRAPEMVDTHLRRPIDEKSDVWALGVLLYKLCYYTTPFEEHGPLAILNVQYRIPPYPVYSGQMNALIASMLREHNSQRPSVFEILNVTHALRGTTSRFTYSIPAKPALSPTAASPSSALSSKPFDNLSSFHSRSATNVPTVSTFASGAASSGASAGSGIRARDEVLQAIEPMRRGRPTPASITAFGTGVADRAASPTKPSASGMGKENEEVAKQVRGHKSGMVTSSAWKTKAPTGGVDDPWRPKGAGTPSDAPRLMSPDKGGTFADSFGDSFAPTAAAAVSSGAGLTAPSTGSSGRTGASPTRSAPINVPSRPVAEESSNSRRLSRLGTSVPKDAFHGLGLASSNAAPPQTLGEASKARTGLAAVNGLSSTETARMLGMAAGQASRPSSSLAAPAPAPSTQSSYSPKPSSPRSSHPPNLPSRPATSRKLLGDDATPEERFPSLEELDRTFGSPPSLDPNSAGAAASLPPAFRSQQVTGAAMRDSQASSSQRKYAPSPTPATSAAAPNPPILPQRPILSRKHRSSVTIKHDRQRTGDTNAQAAAAPTTPIASKPATHLPPRDWLTGDDDVPETAVPPRTTGGNRANAGTPVLRESPSKRASIIQKSDVTFSSPKEAVTEAMRPSGSPTPAARNGLSGLPSSLNTTGLSSQTGRGLPDNRSPVRSTVPLKGKDLMSSPTSSSGSDGPEDAKGYRPQDRVKAPGRSKGRQSSVHDLVDLYGGSSRDDSRPPSVAANASAHQRSSTTHGSESRSRPPPFIAPKPHLSSPQKATAHARPPSSSSNQHRRQPSATPVSPPLNTAGSSGSGRSRPQSMFIFPSGVSKSTSTGADNVLALSKAPGLSPPAEQRPRQARRSSISDMVQLYESIATKPLQAPAKPAALKLATRASNASTGSAAMASPSAAAVRFPRLSPTASPTAGRRTPDGGLSSLSVPPGGMMDPSSTGSGRVSPGRTSPGIARTSPMPVVHELPRTSSPDQARLSPVRRTTNATNATNGVPASPTPRRAAAPPQLSSSRSTTTSSDASSAAIRQRRISTPRESTSPAFSRQRERKTSLAPPQPSLVPTGATAAAAAAAAQEVSPVGSPSPERPYQGVGKLIDRWQRNIAEASEASATKGPAKRPGIVAGSGNGRR